MVEVAYYDGRSARRQTAQLHIEGARLSLSGEFGVREAALADIEFAEPTSGAPRLLHFADGASCELRDAAAQAYLDAALAGAGVKHAPVVRMQQQWLWAVAALAGVIVLFVLAYRIGLPWLSKEAAPWVPEVVGQKLSAATLEGLDAQVLQPSKLAPERRQAIAAQLALLAPPASTPRHRLLFRSAPRVGANAFALPNGDIVLLDELVALSADDREIAAVLAHELGHVGLYHGMRNLIQSAVVSTVAAIWFGDISSAVAGLGALALESGYSREFEREADVYAARLLLAQGQGVAPLTTMLRRLEAAHADKKGPAGSQMFASHPEVDARVAALEALQAGRR